MNRALQPGEPTRYVDWGVAWRPCRGESCCGDAWSICLTDVGVRLAVADGLGHGPEAAEAARGAVATIQARGELPLEELVRACHEHLRSTRGVALTLADVDAAADRLTWLGIGNVEAILWRGRPLAAPRSECLICRGGVVGYQLPRLDAFTVPVRAGDTLALATDGIRPAFLDDSCPAGTPQAAAESILARFGRETDDALVLVARYTGGTP